MRPDQLAHAYLEVFFETHDWSALEAIVHPDLVFEGPFGTWRSAGSYLEDLRADPPTDSAHEVLHEFQEGAVACVVYRFQKADVRVSMCQVFECDAGVIRRIELIFDPTQFPRNA